MQQLLFKISMFLQENTDLSEEKCDHIAGYIIQEFRNYLKSL